MKKILFFIPWMGGGGAERTFLNIINNLNRNEFVPILVLCRKRGPYLKLLKEDVKIHCLNISLHFAAIPLAYKIRKLGPDIIISTMRFANFVSVIATRLSGAKPRVILRETNNLSAAGVNPGNFIERLVGWSYCKADNVVALSNGVKDDIINRYGLPTEHITTIYNPIDIDYIRSQAQQGPDESWFMLNKKSDVFDVIAVGKLYHQKGFDILIKAISNIKNVSVRLTILGEGPDRGKLLSLIHRLKLKDRVFMPGFKSNPYSFMSRSDLFVLSSRWEGFGHVIAEAMACGVPVLSTRCPSGPDEIITDDQDGRLCKTNSVDALSCNIEKLLKDEKRRKRYVNAGLESVKRFEVKKIVKEYERLLKEIM